MISKKTRHIMTLIAALMMFAIPSMVYALLCPVGETAGVCNTPTPSQVINLLKTGNTRFANYGDENHLKEFSTAAARTQLATGQKPYAIVLTCSDSRVSPEVLFGKGLGEIFTVRVAGNVVDKHQLASIEYAVEHLGAKMIIVLGHSHCGAVKSTYELWTAPGTVTQLSNNIDSLTASILAPVDTVLAGHSITTEAGKPGVTTTAGKALVEECIAENATVVAEKLKTDSTILDEAYLAGHLDIIKANYDIETGLVSFNSPLCGSAHHGTLYAQPTANFCSIGTASAVGSAPLPTAVAAGTAISGAAGVPEETFWHMKALEKGQSYTLAGRKVKAEKNLTASEVVSAFVSGVSSAGSYIVSGTLTAPSGWTAPFFQLTGIPGDDRLYLTNSVFGDVTDYTTAPVGATSYTWAWTCTQGALTASCNAGISAYPPGSMILNTTSITDYFNVGWSASPTAGVTYVVEESSDGGTNWSVLGTTTINSYSVSGKANGSYKYRVKATKSGYSDSAYSTSNSITVTKTCPPITQYYQTSTSTNGAFNIGWTPSTLTGVSYVVQETISTDGGTTWSAWADFRTQTSNQLQVTGKNTTGNKYQYRVLVRKTGYADSAYSNTGVVTVNLTLPALNYVGAYVPPTGNLSLSWTGSPYGAESYSLETSADGSTWTVVNATVTATSYSAPRPVAGNRWYRVHAHKTGWTDSAWTLTSRMVVP